MYGKCECFQNGWRNITSLALIITTFMCYEVVLILNHKVYWEVFLVDLWLVHIYHKIIPWIGEICNHIT